MPNVCLLWDISASTSLVANDPHLWDTSSPTASLSSPQSLSSSRDNSPDSCSSLESSFERVLQQMVATPSPGTAAAMVRSPPCSSRQLMDNPQPDSAAAIILHPFSSFASGQSVRTLRSDTAAGQVHSLSSLSGQPPLGPPPPSVSALTCQADVSLSSHLKARPTKFELWWARPRNSIPLVHIHIHCCHCCAGFRVRDVLTRVLGIK